MMNTLDRLDDHHRSAEEVDEYIYLSMKERNDLKSDN